MRRETRSKIPAHPYRDSAILYGVLAVAGFGIAVGTGRDAGTAVVVMAAFFVLATAWSWWRFRARIQKEG